MKQYDTLTRRTFLKRAGAAGVADAGGTLWATAPAAARARWFGKRRAPIQHLVISCQENRSFDHYYGYAPQVQARRFGPPPGYTQPDATGVGHAPYGLTALRSADPPHGWSDVHAQYNGGKIDSSTATPPTARATATSRFRTTRRRSCRSTTASSATPASARTTSARCSGQRGRTGSTSCPARRAASRRTASRGEVRLAQVADHPRPARRRRCELEDLLHRLRRCGGRRHRQRRGLLEPLGARPPDHGNARRLPRGLPPRQVAERLLDHPELLDAVRRASGRGRQRRHGLPGGGDQRAPRLSPAGAVRRCSSPTTSTAASSTTSRRRRSMRTASGSGCPSG